MDSQCTGCFNGEGKSVASIATRVKIAGSYLCSLPGKLGNNRTLLNVVVGESPAVFQLFPAEYQSLLISGNTFLFLDLSLDTVDSVGWLHREGNAFAC